MIKRETIKMTFFALIFLFLIVAVSAFEAIENEGEVDLITEDGASVEKTAEGNFLSSGKNSVEFDINLFKESEFSYAVKEDGTLEIKTSEGPVALIQSAKITKLENERIVVEGGTFEILDSKAIENTESMSLILDNTKIKNKKSEYSSDKKMRLSFSRHNIAIAGENVIEKGNGETIASFSGEVIESRNNPALKTLKEGTSYSNYLFGEKTRTITVDADVSYVEEGGEKKVGDLKSFIKHDKTGNEYFVHLEDGDKIKIQNHGSAKSEEASSKINVDIIYDDSELTYIEDDKLKLTFTNKPVTSEGDLNSLTSSIKSKYGDSEWQTYEQSIGSGGIGAIKIKDKELGHTFFTNIKQGGGSAYKLKEGYQVATKFSGNNKEIMTLTLRDENNQEIAKATYNSYTGKRIEASSKSAEFFKKDLINIPGLQTEVKSYDPSGSIRDRKNYDSFGEITVNIVDSNNNHITSAHFYKSGQGGLRPTEEAKPFLPYVESGKELKTQMRIESLPGTEYRRVVAKTGSISTQDGFQLITTKRGAVIAEAYYPVDDYYLNVLSRDYFGWDKSIEEKGSGSSAMPKKLPGAYMDIRKRIKDPGFGTHTYGAGANDWSQNQ